MLTLTARFVGVDLALSQFESAIERQMRAAVREIESLVAASARDDHPYQNRTGLLEANTKGLSEFGGGSIFGSGTDGSFFDGTLFGGVIADREYASYVEDRGFAFLLPAW